MKLYKNNSKKANESTALSTAKKRLTESYIPTTIETDAAKIQHAKDLFKLNSKSLILDLANFHIGYDKILDEKDLFYMFDTEGKLTPRRIYGDIKRLPTATKEDKELVRALGMLWGGLFSDDFSKRFKTPEEAEAKKAEDKAISDSKASEEAERARLENEAKEKCASITKIVAEELLKSTKMAELEKIVEQSVAMPKLSLVPGFIAKATLSFCEDVTKLASCAKTWPLDLSTTSAAEVTKLIMDYVDNLLREVPISLSIKERPDYRTIASIAYNPHNFIILADKTSNTYYVINHPKSRSQVTKLDASLNVVSRDNLVPKTAEICLLYMYREENPVHAHSTYEDTAKYTGISIVKDKTPGIILTAFGLSDFDSSESKPGFICEFIVGNTERELTSKVAAVGASSLAVDFDDPFDKWFMIISIDIATD